MSDFIDEANSDVIKVRKDPVKIWLSSSTKKDPKWNESSETLGRQGSRDRGDDGNLTRVPNFRTHVIQIRWSNRQWRVIERQKNDWKWHRWEGHLLRDEYRNQKEDDNKTSRLIPHMTTTRSQWIRHRQQNFSLICAVCVSLLELDRFCSALRFYKREFDFTIHEESFQQKVALYWRVSCAEFQEEKLTLVSLSFFPIFSLGDHSTSVFGIFRLGRAVISRSKTFSGERDEIDLIKDDPFSRLINQIESTIIFVLYVDDVCLHSRIRATRAIQTRKWWKKPFRFFRTLKILSFRDRDFESRWLSHVLYSILILCRISSINSRALISGLWFYSLESVLLLSAWLRRTSSTMSFCTWYDRKLRVKRTFLGNVTSRDPQDASIWFLGEIMKIFHDWGR